MPGKFVEAQGRTFFSFGNSRGRAVLGAPWKGDLYKAAPAPRSRSKTDSRGLVMRSLTAVSALLVLVVASAEMDDCFRKDSISCIQMELFRQAKGFFEQDKIEIFGGLALTKNPQGAEKSARSLQEDVFAEKQIETAKDLDDREEALENFAFNRVGRLLEDRSLTWNLSPVVADLASASRSLSESIPSEVKDGVSKFLEEGRGKRKKLMRALLPFLLGLKMKLAGFMVLSYFVIALIAKKALLASVVSLAIAGFIALKKLMSNQHGHEVHEVGHGWSGGYSAGGGGGGGWDSYGHDAHGAYSSPIIRCGIQAMLPPGREEPPMFL
ncbi:hypothetical protein GE061_015263 [Apolygus lucorum]|uniref:Osiris 6 n=1 Tax=Apolygus lucorum TaxID=248454 RepID=A0A8S9XNA0_APOLU|nr:hypothetical protein GE061_015263 [Apolygus lucorum]